MDHVQVYDSRSEAYEHAFAVFLAHTNQKETMDKCLQNIIANLPRKHTLIDAGAGEGKATRRLAPLFQHTTAIEPNPFLYQLLKAAIPQATLIDKIITEANPHTKGDLVLCSHTLYYIAKEEWLTNLERLVSWMSPQGKTIVVLQNKNTDCMKMLDHFHHRHFDLSQLAETFTQKYNKKFNVNIECIEAHVETQDFTSAYTIAEFMLNLLPIKSPPTKTEFESYIQTHLKQGNGYRFSCNQDILQISSL